MSKNEPYRKDSMIIKTILTNSCNQWYKIYELQITTFVPSKHNL